MRINCIAIFASGILILSLGSAMADESEGHRIITKKTEKIRVSVQIGSRLEGVHAKSIWWGTIDTEDVKEIRDYVERLTINVAGEVILVPLSAYADLCSFRHVELQENHNRFLIKIKGGHAASSYLATIIVNDSRVVERNVVHGEFRNTVLERTIYSEQKVVD